MKTHYAPYPDYIEFIETQLCGSIISSEFETSDVWDHVDCKRCLQIKENILKKIQWEVDKIGEDYFKHGQFFENENILEKNKCI